MEELTHEDVDALERRRKITRRIGWGVIGLGMGLGIVAALIGGAAARRSDLATVDGALVLRNIAAVIMLAGLVTLLIAQRLEAFQGWFLRRIEGTTDRAAPVQAFQTRTILYWSVVLLALWSAASGLPMPTRGRLVVLASLAVPAFAALFAVQLRGTHRAFLIGIFVAAIGNLAVVTLAVIVLVSDAGSIRAARELGRYFYPVTTGMWIFAFFVGLLSAACRDAFVNKTR